MILTLFDKLYSRRFELKTMMDFHNIVYIHDGHKKIISTFGNGLISSLETAAKNNFTWQVSPEDIWLLVLQHTRQFIKHPGNNIIKGQGLVYEANVTSIFNQLDHPVKKLYDINFSTSNYGTNMVFKLTFLGTSQDYRTYSIDAPKKVILKGTQSDWDDMLKHYDTLHHIFPTFQSQLRTLGSFLVSFANQKPSLDLLNDIKASSDGCITQDFPLQYTKITGGFIGASLDPPTQSVCPNISWYVTRPPEHRLSRASLDLIF